MKNFAINFIKKQTTHTLPPEIFIKNDSIFITVDIHRNQPAYIDASKDGSIIKIHDIKARVRGIGIGSKMMQKLIEYAKENKIETIQGIITPTDAEHTPWITDYYKKFGFEITPANTENEKYNISLTLKSQDNN